MVNDADHSPPLKPKIVHRSAAYHRPSRLQAWLIGRPLPSADAPHQAVGKLVGLAIFASDALSSTAYATQEILWVLAAAGSGALQLSLPIALGIVGLLAIVTISYEQTIHAYSGGGGAYIVSRDNLGELPAQIAGAALLTDYILTVAVSVSAGTAQILSAIPDLAPYRVTLAVGLVILIMTLNLRGVRESGSVFAIPTYFFLFMMFLTIIVGLYRFLTGSLENVVNPPELEIAATQAVTAFLVLRAFSNGTTALTGVEAISNGIPAFKSPSSRNAGNTLVWMALILGVLFFSLTFLAVKIGAVPSEHETVVSQIARTTLGGRGALYLAVISSTTLILVMAANTAFADFPRLGALQAADGYLPRQLTYRGSRLVYTWGIAALGLIASLLIVLFQAQVSLLIPLYAVGVFLSFTLSQTGMARRWWKSGRLDPGTVKQEAGSVLEHNATWVWKMLVNGFGALCTAVVALIFAITKFRDGAWLVIILIPSLVLLFSAIHRHYRNLASHLSLADFRQPELYKRRRVILPISGVHRGTLAALRLALSWSEDVTAIHIIGDQENSEAIERKWQKWGRGVPLVMIESPYRELMHPLVTYIDEILARRKPGEVITVVVPEFVPTHWWHNLLHMQTAAWLRTILKHRKGVVVVDVPYQVD